jgi:hypothetical protein
MDPSLTIEALCADALTATEFLMIQQDSLQSSEITCKIDLRNIKPPLDSCVREAYLLDDDFLSISLDLLPLFSDGVPTLCRDEGQFSHCFRLLLTQCLNELRNTLANPIITLIDLILARLHMVSTCCPVCWVSHPSSPVTLPLSIFPCDQEECGFIFDDSLFGVVAPTLRFDPNLIDLHIQVKFCLVSY